MEDNSIAKYVIIYVLIAFIFSPILVWVTTHFKNAFIQPVFPGSILFFMGIIILGIFGLAAPPDLSIKMLEQSEREHFRYIVLYIGAFLFGLFFINLFINNLLNLKNHTKWLMMALFIISIIELL